MPARGGGQGGQHLRNGHAGGLGTVVDFFLGDGGQYGTLGVTWGQERGGLEPWEWCADPPVLPLCSGIRHGS